MDGSFHNIPYATTDGVRSGGPATLNNCQFSNRLPASPRGCPHQATRQYRFVP